jgi:hypothetical protein
LLVRTDEHLAIQAASGLDGLVGEDLKAAISGTTSQCGCHERLADAGSGACDEVAAFHKDRCFT